jgi:cysteine desulfuration protein SufE
MAIQTIQEKQDEIVSEFEVFDDWMEKYEYLIDLGKDLPLIKEELKTDERLIESCQSRVWLNANCENGKMQFSADSEAIITKGIIGLLIRVLNDEHPETILKTDLKFIYDIGLQEHLSPTRANGLNGMIKKMKIEALKYIQH